jgi:hypothetical protein
VIRKRRIDMDKIVAKIAALGVPGLVLVIAISATGLAGGAAITAALAALGPGGMIGGIATLGVLGLISEGIAKYGMDAIFSAVVIELYKRGETKESILNKIQKYPVSKDLKRRLRESLEKVARKEV